MRGAPPATPAIGDRQEPKKAWHFTEKMIHRYTHIVVITIIIVMFMFIDVYLHLSSYSIDMRFDHQIKVTLPVGVFVCIYNIYIYIYIYHKLDLIGLESSKIHGLWDTSST